MDAYLFRGEFGRVGDALALEVSLSASDTVAEVFEYAPLFLAVLVLGHRSMYVVRRIKSVARSRQVPTSSSGEPTPRSRPRSFTIRAAATSCMASPVESKTVMLSSSRVGASPATTSPSVA